LTQEGIPIISSESLLLKNSLEVQFLVDLLRIQNRPDDLEIAFNLLSYLYKDKIEQHELIEKHLKNLSSLLINEFDFDTTKTKESSVFDALEYAIKQFDLAPYANAYVNFFMDTVFEVEQKEGTGIPAFLSYWEKKKDKLSITAPSSINAVQIMTIHKSKGLEFEVVIYPFAHSKIYNDGKIWLPVKSEIFEGFEEILINKKQEVVHYNDTAANLFEEENNKQELDA